MLHHQRKNRSLIVYLTKLDLHKKPAAAGFLLEFFSASTEFCYSS
ncbi:hypothetical protein F887_03647 [Acinetobacter sp. NIPH 2100]|nr:hypothetical protein F887_03647 [Acinetobacter sp. NIPH 2100]